MNNSIYGSLGVILEDAYHRHTILYMPACLEPVYIFVSPFKLRSIKTRVVSVLFAILTNVVSIIVNKCSSNK